jgi:hypothetical protein
MRRLVGNAIPVLLLAFSASDANAASICELNPLPPASGKRSVAQDFGHAKEDTKESYTQGGYTKSIH